jgi:hypothetical protein
MTAQRMKGT